MVVRMVMHIVKFVNGFPRKGGVRHFSPGEIMMGRHPHVNNLSLGFGVYYQVAENVEPRNSLLAPCTRAAICLAIQEICQAAKFSLHWTPATQLLGINRWYS
jgi:hypothetical protein